jgi:hypothetical protein
VFSSPQVLCTATTIHGETPPSLFTLVFFTAGRRVVTPSSLCREPHPSPSKAPQHHLRRHSSPFSPPLVVAPSHGESPTSSNLARSLLLSLLVLHPKTSPPPVHWQATTGRATMQAMHAVTARRARAMTPGWHGVATTGWVLGWASLAVCWETP